jgi:hypothetical protein
MGLIVYSGSQPSAITAARADRSVLPKVSGGDSTQQTRPRPLAVLTCTSISYLDSYAMTGVPSWGFYNCRKAERFTIARFA